LEALKSKPSSAPSVDEVKSSASLLEKRAEAGGGLANFTAVPSQNYMIKEPVKRMTTRLQPINIGSAAPDMSSQIRILTGGGAAAAAQTPRRGMTIAQLMGISPAKKNIGDI
jgi:hypothetical protein